ncbi:hypothetical protein B0A49_01731 [Cryomyces minteri]|uniref:ARCA protein n=1 Tax=Cryomyces minteri TaxID=331657 RepID=A0A4U0XL05_9PEZI|nr:hypothetical protein B0A49_01731 [Cryomyces minteri]
MVGQTCQLLAAVSACISRIGNLPHGMKEDIFASTRCAVPYSPAWELANSCTRDTRILFSASRARKAARHVELDSTDPDRMSELQDQALEIVANAKGSGLGKCDYDFSANQTWITTSSKNLSFIDETQELVSIYDRECDEPANAATTPLDWGGSNFSAPVPSQHLANVPDVTSVPASRPIAVRTDSYGDESINDANSPSKRRRFTFSSNSFHGSPEQSSVRYHHSPVASNHALSPVVFSSTSGRESVHDAARIDPSREFAALEPTISSTSELGTGFSTVSDSLSRVYLDAPVWPLQDRKEAHLMRYFIDHLAVSFDLCDPDRHFALVVPHRAAYLIPMLDDTAAILDENLLASTVILRFLEEIEVPISGADTQSHLLGTHVFISAQERSTVGGGLRQAAFWVGLRQEIYVAFVNQRSILPALEHCNIDRSFEPADDCTWSNRMIVHCADVIRYCFGDGEQTTSHYTKLLDYCMEWHAFKPPSFSPIFFRDWDTTNVFPEIWLLGDAVVTGLQHYHLAKILLTAHNPKTPRLGPGRMAALRIMDEEIKDDVRSLCGMAQSNNKTPPNYVTACMAIAMAGDKFTMRNEQEALLAILEQTESFNGWPTRTAQKHLKEAWGYVL